VLVVERTQGADPFDVEEDAVLVQVARQLGLVLALEASFDELRRHAAELRHSRARLVAAADEARRQIERNLHDGAQNHLVVILGTLHEAAEKLGTRGAPEVLALIEEARHALEESVHELRDLAHGVFPPVLADRGLTEALRSAARRMKLPVNLDANGFDRLDAKLESAVYFCCLEALQNVKKHAGDSASVDIRLRHEPGKLHFEVTDNGRGFDLTASGGGAGLVNMRDRLEAVGGQLSLNATPGNGCTVKGDIPLRGDRTGNSSGRVSS
ncbi:MAG: histidine kinase, partial [Actinomycetota bacterium]|nr:histidine kinase [Actinomycetota bacterium]